jgi:hypothetical protein
VALPGANCEADRGFMDEMGSRKERKGKQRKGREEMRQMMDKKS